MTPAEARTRVERGAAWLDEEVGAGVWEPRIRLDEFDMSSPCRCVLGWTFRGQDEVGYADGIQRAPVEPHERDTWAVAHGFERETGSDGEYYDLRGAWMDLLRARGFGVGA